MANRNRVPPFEEDGPRSPPPAARPVPRTRPPGSLGTAAHPQHHRHRHRPRRRIRRHRPRPHPVHRRARPHPLPRRRRHLLPALRPPPRQPAGQPEHRDPRPAPPPSGPPANIRENRSRTTNQAHRRSHLHPRHHKVESPEMGHNSGNLRAVATARSAKNTKGVSIATNKRPVDRAKVAHRLRETPSHLVLLVIPSSHLTVP